MKNGTMILMVLGLLFFVAPSVLQAQGWRNSTDTDEMTGELQAFAMSARVAPRQRMAFPYNSVRGWLGFGCDGEDEWAFVGFTDSPNLTNTTPQDGGYSTFTTRIRWDEDVETVRMTQRWGANFLHFRTDAPIIRKMIEAGSVLLELEWFGSGDVYFLFSLQGSEDAIETARQSCGGAAGKSRS